MKVVIILSLLALAAARPQFHYAAVPTAGPFYYKQISPALYYPGYLQGQFRQVREGHARSEEAPVEETVAELPAEEPAQAEARSDDEPASAPAPAPVVYTTAAPPPPVYTTAAPAAPAPAAPAPEPRSYPAPAPAYHPEPSYNPAAYNFEWLVKDDYSKNDYGQKESRNGKNIQGSYHVALPDGRVQTITYSVDGYGGYVADVSYSGEAQYPDTPAYAPAYKPAPRAYKPAPTPAYAPAYKPAPRSYKPAPTPAPYKPAPTPAPYKPAPAPYKPAPAPYKPAPAPYKPAPAPYKPAPAYKPTPSYPIQPASSVRRYSFKTINDEPVAKEASVVEEIARSAEGVAVTLSEAEVPVSAVESVAPIENVAIEETARSDTGITIVDSFEEPEEIDPLQVAESKIDVIVDEPREEKALSDDVAQQTYEEPAAAYSTNEVVEAPVEAPLNYRYYYRY